MLILWVSHIGSYIYCLFRVPVYQIITNSGCKAFCQGILPVVCLRNSSNQEPEAEHLSKHLPYCRLALNEATDIPNRKGVVSPIVMTFSDQKQAFFNGDIVSCWLKELFSLFSRYSPMKPPANNKIHVPLSHYQMEYTVSRADFISTR